MEPTSAMITAVVGYMAKKLKDNRSVNELFDDFTDKTTRWIRKVLFKEDNQPKEVLEDLKDDPEDELNTKAAENTLAKALRKDPEAGEYLKTMYELLQQKAAKGESISIEKSKNVNTGTIQAGGNVTIGDSKNSK